jgi:hypothetical protein
VNDAQSARYIDVFKKLMADTFHTIIPTLPDPELEEYRRNYFRFELEAVEAALAELRKRGHDIPDDEIDAIRARILERDAAEGGGGTGQGSPAPRGLRRMDKRQIRRVAGMILALGLAGALTIYLAVGPQSSDLPGYDPMDSKKYLRELELYGGKPNVLFVEFQQWFSGLWHGRPLAGTVAVLTVLLAFAFWFVASNQSSDAGDPTEADAKPERTL